MIIKGADIRTQKINLTFTLQKNNKKEEEKLQKIQKMYKKLQKNKSY